MKNKDIIEHINNNEYNLIIFVFEDHDVEVRPLAAVYLLDKIYRLRGWRINSSSERGSLLIYPLIND
jgi:hypothetical protein